MTYASERERLLRIYGKLTQEQEKNLLRHEKIREQLAALASEAYDAENYANDILSGNYCNFHIANERLPYCIRRIEYRLKRVKEFWNGKGGKMKQTSRNNRTQVLTNTKNPVVQK